MKRTNRNGPALSVIHSSFGPREVEALHISAEDAKSMELEDFAELSDIGIGGFDELAEIAMDALTPLQTTASIATPAQFLQAWMPGFVVVATQPLLIDEIVGIQTIGEWEDEEVVQGIMELTGEPALYGDLTNIPLSSWNAGWERRSIVRFEEGLSIGYHETKVTGKAGINNGEMKRKAAAEALNIKRNEIGFYGYNNGANRTYGLLNDPSLPAYITVANPGGGTTWPTKNFLQITADLRVAIGQLITQTKGLYDPENDAATLVIPSNKVTFLSVTSDFGNSVRQWLSDNYPKIRIKAAPQFTAANGGSDVFYLFVESMKGDSTDDGRTFVQMVPTKIMMVGTEVKAKRTIEDYTNATAGVMVKRPWLVVRYSGI